MLALLPAGLVGTAVAGEPEIAAGDRSAAVEKLGGGSFTRLDRIKQRHLDGVRGLTVHAASERPPRRNVTGDSALDDVWSVACRSAEFGLFELESAKSFVGQDDEGIFTKLRFKRLEDWRGDVRSPAGVVQLVISGGEVVHKGETIRIDNPYGKYEVGSTYVLAAGNRSAPTRERTIYDDPPFMEVRDATIYAAPGWTPFASGTSLKSAKASVAKALDAKACE